ncbi:MAG TPA: hypothetical protein VJZ74_09380 [Pseudolabrys sp.]|nr:hypothetical protein [Pseudolabrys sp.]
MKMALTIAVAGAALAATLSLVLAGTSEREPATEAAALPAHDIVATVRAMRLVPLGEPARRGPYYILHAYDPRGLEVRVVADAQLGSILSVAPTRTLNAVYTPRYERGPRIIHVPQGETDADRTGVNERDEPAAANDDAAKAVAPPVQRRATPRPRPRGDAARVPQRRSVAPPPPGPRRTVLSVPPPPAEGPSSIDRTSRSNSNTDSGEKFGPPRDSASAPDMPPPPPGYTPPAALPRSD